MTPKFWLTPIQIDKYETSRVLNHKNFGIYFGNYFFAACLIMPHEICHFYFLLNLYCLVVSLECLSCINYGAGCTPLVYLWILFSNNYSAIPKICLTKSVCLHFCACLFFFLFLYRFLNVSVSLSHSLSIFFSCLFCLSVTLRYFKS